MTIFSELLKSIVLHRSNYMSDAFDKSWSIVKMGQEHDDEERRMIQHIVSMAMGMSDDESGDYGMGYLDALQESGKELSDLVSRRYGETGGVKGGYMRESDKYRGYSQEEADDDRLDDWPYVRGMSQEDIAAIEQEDYMAFGTPEQQEAYFNARNDWGSKNPEIPRPSDFYEAPSMVRGVDSDFLNMLRRASPEQIEMIREMLG